MNNIINQIINIKGDMCSEDILKIIFLLLSIISYYTHTHGNKKTFIVFFIVFEYALFWIYLFRNYKFIQKNLTNYLFDVTTKLIKCIFLNFWLNIGQYLVIFVILCTILIFIRLVIKIKTKDLKINMWILGLMVAGFILFFIYQFIGTFKLLQANIIMTMLYITILFSLTISRFKNYPKLFVIRYGESKYRFRCINVISKGIYLFDFLFFNFYFLDGFLIVLQKETGHHFYDFHSLFYSLTILSFQGFLFFYDVVSIYASMLS